VTKENTAETIKQLLYEVFIKRGISSKVFRATMDYGKDIVKVYSLLDTGVMPTSSVLSSSPIWAVSANL
jgi:hypothetical protein